MRNAYMWMTIHALRLSVILPPCHTGQHPVLCSLVSCSSLTHAPESVWCSSSPMHYIFQTLAIRCIHITLNGQAA
ncbi:hypothetical protein C8J57DRAFT_1529435 [Mycena rebaudengoi]|nr:hypothetical protein C8J57DRAFT_1529435 [Mycena rebaudengoi]